MPETEARRARAGLRGAAWKRGLRSCYAHAASMGLRPLTIILPLVILLVLLGIGLYGILQAAHAQENQAQDKAGYLVKVVADSLLASFQVLSMPTVSMATQVVFDGPAAGANETSHWCQTASAGIAYLPAAMQAGVRATFRAAKGVVDTACGNKNYAPPIGLDLLSVQPELQLAMDPEARKKAGWADDGVRLGPHVLVQGPFPGRGSESPFLVISRVVFVAHNISEQDQGFWDWGTPDIDEYDCLNADDESCGVENFWGVVGIVASLETLIANSDRWATDLSDYEWAVSISTPQHSNNPWELPGPNSSARAWPPHLIMSSADIRLIRLGPGLPDVPDLPYVWSLYNAGVRPLLRTFVSHPVARSMPMQQQSWRLEIGPPHGWKPSWQDKVVALIVVIAVALPALLLSVLASRDQIAQQRAMLNTLLPRNVVKKLWAEHDLYVKRARKLDMGWIELGTPAATMLEVATGLLEGRLPSTQDVLLVRTAILHAWDLYTPVGGWLRDQMAGEMDREVMDALAHTLGMGAPSERGTLTTPSGLARARTMMRQYQYDEGGGSVYHLYANPSASGTETDAGDPEEVLAMLQGLMSMQHAPPMHSISQTQLVHKPSTASLSGIGEGMHQHDLPSPISHRDVEGAGNGGMSTQASNLVGKLSGGSGVAHLRKLAMSLGGPHTSLPGSDGSGGRGSSGPGWGLDGTSGNGQPVSNSALTVSGVVPKTPLPFLSPGSAFEHQFGKGGVKRSCSTSLHQVALTNTPGGSHPPSPSHSQLQHLTSAGEVSAFCSSLARGSHNPQMATWSGGVVPYKSSSGQTGMRQGLISCELTASPGAVPPGVLQASDDLGLTPAKSEIGPGDRRGDEFAEGESEVTVTGNVIAMAAAGALPSQISNTDLRKSSPGVGRHSKVQGFEELHLRAKQHAAHDNASTQHELIVAAGGAGIVGAAAGLKAAIMKPRAPLLEEVEALLAHGASSWTFDSFALAEATRGHPLSTLAYYLLAKETRLLSTWKLPAASMARYLRLIEAGYPDHPYHNATHAADVLQTLHVIAIHSGMISHYIDPLTHLALYLSAVVHDYEHAGRTNDFLVNSSHPLAMLYNDRSPMENHHTAAALSLMVRPDVDLVSRLEKAERDKLRKTMIELVLGTDMKQHLSITSRFTTVHRIDTQGAADKPVSHSRTSGATRSSTADAPTLQEAWAVQPVMPLDEAERMLSLQMALKCADVGHLTESLETHKRWVSKLEEEFFLQGDAEKAAGLPISPLFDRTKPGVTKSQPGFFDFVALPLFKAFTTIFPGCQPLMGHLDANYQYWKSLAAAVQSTNSTNGEGAAATPAPAPAAGAHHAHAPAAAGGGDKTHVSSAPRPRPASAALSAGR